MAHPTYRRRWTIKSPANPAVGVEWALRAPGSAIWRIVSLAATLTTSAVVANRRVRLIADDQTRTWYAEIASADQVASTTTVYCAHTGASGAGLTAAVLTLPLPAAGLLLRPGHFLRSSVVNLDPGDQWASVAAVIDEVPSDVPYIGDHTVIATRDVGE